MPNNLNAIISKLLPLVQAKAMSRDQYVKAELSYVPDILLVSMYDSEKDEVAAFEELIGSHGGVGSSQSNPFILYPSEWNIEDVEIIGAENVYRLFKGEIANASTKFYESKTD